MADAVLSTATGSLAERPLTIFLEIERLKSIIVPTHAPTLGYANIKS